MDRSLVYRSAGIYELVMLVLYGRHYFSRCAAVAELIPEGASVLEVCCGPGRLYHRHLKHKAVRYTGLDLNERFIAHLVRRGGRGEVWDLGDERPLPAADYVVMQASLYHFLPDPAPVVDRMLRAAGAQVIVAEPVRNLATNNIPLLSWLARRETDAGLGRQPHRFTEQTLDTFFAAYSSRLRRSFLIPGGREKVYVLEAR